MKKKIESLSNGSWVLVGGAEVWRINDVYFLFEIKLLAEKTMYSGVFALDSVDKMVKVIESWT